MEVFSLATWRAALSAICGEEKGLKELETSTIYERPVNDIVLLESVGMLVVTFCMS